MTVVHNVGFGYVYQFTASTFIWNMKLIIEDHQYDQVGKSFSLQNFMGQAAIKEKEEALMREANVVCFMTLFKLSLRAC